MLSFFYSTGPSKGVGALGVPKAQHVVTFNFFSICRLCLYKSKYRVINDAPKRQLRGHLLINMSTGHHDLLGSIHKFQLIVDMLSLKNVCVLVGVCSAIGKEIESG